MTRVATGSGTTLTDAAPLSGDAYYLVTAKDASGAVATSVQTASVADTRQVCLPARRKIAVVNIIDCGDSITFGSNGGTSSFAYLLPPAISEIFPDLVVNGDGTSTWDKGVPGTTSTNWANGTTGGFTLADVIAQATPGQINIVPTMLGTNDSKTGVQTTPALYASNMQAICNALIAGGCTPVLFPPPYAIPGSNAEWDEIHSLPLLTQYRDAIVSICNGTTIFLGGDRTFEAFVQQVEAGNTVFGAADVHPNVAGHLVLTNINVAGVAAVVSQKTGLPPMGGGTTASGIIRVGMQGGFAA